MARRDGPDGSPRTADGSPRTAVGSPRAGQGVARLAAAFAGGRAGGRALVMPFLVCGYPDRRAFLEIAAAAGAGGADVLEIGIPFSDPIMDGPTIQEASTRVLANGLRREEAFELLSMAAERAGCPVVAMTYYNLVFRAGLDAFADACDGGGLAGVIVPDLSVEEADPWRDACREAGLAPVFMVAPTSTPGRIEAVAAAGEGFIYAASTLGVTGVREEISARARDLVARVRDATDLPVAVGIGVSTAEHARAVASYADGVIVGSALVRLIDGAPDPAGAVGAFVARLRAAVIRPGGPPARA